MNCASNVGCLCLAMIPRQNRKGVLVLVNSSVAWLEWAVGRRQWARGRWARGQWDVDPLAVGRGRWAKRYPYGSKTKIVRGM